MTNEKLIHLDLFSGIGGFALAVEAVWGKENVEHIFCDNEPFAQAILKKHWPEAKIYGDIRTLTADAEYTRLARTEEARTDSRTQSKGTTGTKLPLTKPSRAGALRAEETRRVFILTGGFPCQPFSQAGRRKGTADDRFLWPEMARVIGEFKPTWVIAENVRGILTIDNGMVFEQVCLDLEGLGYEVIPFIIPAVAVGAPHRRDRVWFVAHAKNFNDRRDTRELPRSDEQQEKERQEERTTQPRGTDKLNAPDTRQQHGQRSGKGMETIETKRSARAVSLERGSQWDEAWPEVATRLCTLDDGLPSGLARPKGWRNAALKGAGNAIVPQVAEEIMRAIKEI